MPLLHHWRFLAAPNIVVHRFYSWVWISIALLLWQLAWYLPLFLELVLWKRLQVISIFIHPVSEVYVVLSNRSFPSSSERKQRAKTLFCIVLILLWTTLLNTGNFVWLLQRLLSPYVVQFHFKFSLCSSLFLSLPFSLPPLCPALSIPSSLLFPLLFFYFD